MKMQFKYDIKYDNFFYMNSLCLPPKEAYLYVPQEKDLFINNERLIYEGGIQYNQEELSLLDEFFDFIKTHNYQLPEFLLPPLSPEHHVRPLILRYIYAAKKDIKEGYNLLMKYTQWRNEIYPVELTDDTFELINQGLLYCFGRDKGFRPIIYGNFNVLVKGKKYSLEETKRIGVFVLNHVLKYMMIPGQVENWVVIGDLHHLGVTDIPVNFIKTMIMTFQIAYKARLYRQFIVNANTFAFIIFNIVKAFLSSTVSRKVKMYRKSNPKEILEYIDPNQLLKEYGGNVEKPTQFWPPTIPNGHFGVDSSQIYSEEQYQNFLQRNPLAIPRQDYSSKIRDYRGKPGLIPHEEIILTDRAIRKDSYNGISDELKEKEQKSLIIDKSEINNYSEIRDEVFLDKSNLLKECNSGKYFIKNEDIKLQIDKSESKGNESGRVDIIINEKLQLRNNNIIQGKTDNEIIENNNICLNKNKTDEILPSKQIINQLSKKEEIKIRVDISKDNIEDKIGNNINVQITNKEVTSNNNCNNIGNTSQTKDSKEKEEKKKRCIKCDCCVIF